MTTGEEDMLNPVFGFEIRGQNNQEVTTSSLPKSTVATQGLYNKKTNKKKNLHLWCSQKNSVIVIALMSDTCIHIFSSRFFCR